MLIKSKENKICAECNSLVTVQDVKENKNQLYKTKEGAIVCRNCFWDADIDIEEDSESYRKNEQHN